MTDPTWSVTAFDKVTEWLVTEHPIGSVPIDEARNAFSQPADESMVGADFPVLAEQVEWLRGKSDVSFDFDRFDYVFAMTQSEGGADLSAKGHPVGSPRWKVTVFDKTTKRLVAQHRICDTSIDEARSAFSQPAHEPMIDVFVVSDEQVEWLRSKEDILFDFGRFEYHFEMAPLEDSEVAS